MTETSSKLVEEIKQIIDITSRVDERVKMIAESQHQINNRLNHFIDEHNSLVSRVHVIESKNGHKTQELITTLDEKLMKSATRIEILETVGSQKSQKIAGEFDLLKIRVKELEDHRQGLSDRAKTIINYIWQGAFLIIMGYVLYRLGLPTPPVP